MARLWLHSRASGRKRRVSTAGFLVVALIAAACQYVPGDYPGSVALSQCLGQPATIGIGWAAPEGSTVSTYTGTPGNDVVVITNGPLIFNGGGGDDLICLNNAGLPDGPAAAPTVINGQGGNDTIVNLRGDIALEVSGGGGTDMCIGMPATAVVNCETEIGLDPYPATPDVIDSFGDTTPWAYQGITQTQWETNRPAAWDGVDDYHALWAQTGDCSFSQHASWWTQAADGKLYPSWHPPADGGCSFGHEHGEDPRTSPLYDASGGVPFGYANEVFAANHPTAPRMEDHAGQKVIVRTDWTPAFGNGGNTGSTLYPVTGVTCDWLSKVHQGTSTADAFRMNLHEYHLNLSCNGRSGSGSWIDRPLGATTVHIKELIHFGDPLTFIRDCDPDVVVTLSGPTPHWTTERRAPYINDGKREIACAEFYSLNQGNRRDLWKPDGIIEVPQTDGTMGQIAFSAYYSVWNPVRVMDEATNELVYSVDLCFNPDGTWRNEPDGPLCAGLTPAIRNAPAATRWYHPDSPFLGNLRGVSPKSVPVWNDLPLSNGPSGLSVFCTDAMGETSVVPPATGCDHATQIQQTVGGSNLWQDGAIEVAASTEAGLTAAGPGLEWLVTHPSADVHGPN